MAKPRGFGRVAHIFDDLFKSLDIDRMVDEELEDMDVSKDTPDGTTVKETHTEEKVGGVVVKTIHTKITVTRTTRR